MFTFDYGLNLCTVHTKQVLDNRSIGVIIAYSFLATWLLQQYRIEQNCNIKVIHTAS